MHSMLCSCNVPLVGSANSVLKAHALQKSGNQVLMHTNAHGNEYAADIISMNCENSGLVIKLFSPDPTDSLFYIYSFHVTVKYHYHI